MPLAPAVLARLTPYLQRLVTTRPDIWGRFLASAKSAGVVVGSSAKDVVAYIKNNPLQSATLMGLLAQAGAAVSDLWSPSDKSAPEQRNMVLSLDRLYLTSQGVDDEGIEKIEKASDKSEELKGLVSGISDLHTARAILAWARAHYGSVNAALRAHSLHQAFFEMSRDDVENGYEVLDV